MIAKNIVISGRKFKVYGHKDDRYFNNFLSENKHFYDTPIAFFEKHALNDSVIFDIGANIGTTVCSASEVSPKGIVIAIEASPDIFKYLKRTISSNKLKNVIPLNIAASDRKKSLKFFQDDDFLAGSRVVKNGQKKSETISIPARKLDDIVKGLNLDKVDIIKLDVEGHEPEVLRGAKKTLKKFKPFCLIEFNSFVMINENRQLPQDFMKQLSSIFPRIYAFDRKTLGINEITENTNEFIRNNLLTGCVDDLVCGYSDLPYPGDWFKKHNK